MTRYTQKLPIPGETPAEDAPRTRRCLKCKTSFHSEWSGERICSRCKGSSAWRNAASLKPTSSGRRG